MGDVIPTQSGAKGRNLALEAGSRPAQVDPAPSPKSPAHSPFVFNNIPTFDA